MTHPFIGLSGDQACSDRLHSLCSHGNGPIDLAAASGRTSTAVDLASMVEKLEAFTMRALEQTAPGTDDGPLDARLRHALRQAFGATLSEPLSADRVALAAGQPPSGSLQMQVGSECRFSRTMEARGRA